MTRLFHQTRLGLGWLSIGQCVKKASVLVVSIALARLLSPEDFGLIGMAFVFCQCAKILGDLGLGAGIIQKSELRPAHLNAVFGANIILGIVLFACFWTGADLIARFYDEPRLGSLIRVIAISFIFDAIKVVQLSLMEREMRFKQLMIIETISEVISAAVVVSFALFGWGVWSLVAQYVVPTILVAICVWIVSPWRPTGFFDRTAFNELRGFGFNLLGSNVVNYFIRNLDAALIGKYIGSAALGIYGWGYRLMLFPIYQVSGVMTRLMFPTFASIQHDRERIKDIYLKATRVIALVMFPFMTGMFILTEPFVVTLLGEKWLAVVPVLKMLCIAGLIQCVGTTTGWIYTSQGRTDLQLKVAVISLGVYTVGFALGLRWGIVGVATGYVVSGCLILLYPTWVIPLRLIDISFFDMLKNLFPSFMSSMVMAGAIVIGEMLLPAGFSAWQQLIALSIFGVAVYWLIVSLMGVEAYADFRRFIFSCRDGETGGDGFQSLNG